MLAYLLIVLGNDAHAVSEQFSDRLLDNVLDILQFNQYLELKSNQIRVKAKVVFRYIHPALPTVAGTRVILIS